MSEEYPDGEAIYQVARMLARVEAKDLALDLLSRAVGRGFYPIGWFEKDPWLDSIRDEPAFLTACARARELHQAAASAFDAAGGPTLLKA